MGGRPEHEVMKFKVSKLKTKDNSSQMSREVKQKMEEGNNVFENHGIKKQMRMSRALAVPTWLPPSALSPRGLSFAPPHPSISSPLICCTLSIPPHRLHTICFLSPLYLWLSPLTRMQAHESEDFCLLPQHLERGWHTLHSQ